MIVRCKQMQIALFSQLLLDSVRQVNIIYKDRLGCMALIGCMALVLWLLAKQLKFGKSSTGRTKPQQYAFSSNWLLVLLRSGTPQS